MATAFAFQYLIGNVVTAEYAFLSALVDYRFQYLIGNVVTINPSQDFRSPHAGFNTS